MLLRPTTLEDLQFVLDVEHAEPNREFIIPWSRAQHALSLSDDDVRHFVAVRKTDQTPVGYVILAGLTNPNQCVELKRIVISEKGRGYGRAAVRAVKHLVLGELQAHRLWLDVKETNHRAQTLYESEGFIREGLLRECLKVGDRYESLLLMSILRNEHAPGR